MGNRSKSSFNMKRTAIAILAFAMAVFLGVSVMVVPDVRAEEAAVEETEVGETEAEEIEVEETEAEESEAGQAELTESEAEEAEIVEMEAEEAEAVEAEAEVEEIETEEQAPVMLMMVAANATDVAYIGNTGYATLAAAFAAADTSGGSQRLSLRLILT